MAIISITVPNGTIPRIVEALAVQHQYAARKLVGETKAQFAERITKDWWKRQVLNVEARAAEKAAGDAIRTNPADPLVTDPD